jgi:hypothetical protein
MAEIFYINSIPVKTNYLGDILKYSFHIQKQVKNNVYCGGFDNYWWIVPKEFRTTPYSYLKKHKKLKIN